MGFEDELYASVASHLNHQHIPKICTIKSSTVPQSIVRVEKID
jgi:hypothetical protein